MPVFFQHTAADLHLLIWEIQEPDAFFESSLPLEVTQAAPTHPDRKRQFLAGRFGLRTLVPDFRFERILFTESGRPYLSNDSWQFSISHTAQFASVLMSQTQAVGIDIESVSGKAGRVRRKFLREEEEKIWRALVLPSHPQPDELMYTLAWSVKEAAFKALHQTGVDFIRDLPIEQVEWQGNIGTVKLGGKGSGLTIQAQLLGEICLAWAGRPR